MAFDIEHFPTSESALKMLNTVTKGFYDNSYVGKWIFQVIGQEYDIVEEIAGQLPKQFFIETATWGLMYHELKWGLPIRDNLPYEERRRLIYQKRDFKAPMTPFGMETYLRKATGFEVHILDCHDAGEYGFYPKHPNVFKAVFIGDGTLNTKVVRELLDKIKQSHTTYTISDRIIVIIDNRSLEKVVYTVIKANTKFKDVRGKIVVSQTLRTTVAPSIEEIETAVTIKRNAWYFDGTFSFDGEKLFNAEVRKEEL